MRPERLELPAYWFEASRSIQLSYGRTFATVHTSLTSRRATPIRYPDRVKKPIETEIKLRVENAAQARSLLRRHGFRVIKRRVFERNLVLDDEAGSLRERGMLLRVRGAGKPGGLKIVSCTFKGVEKPGRHKSREEREFRADNLESCVALFAALGFREAFRYEKYRTELAHAGEPGHVTLDETPIGIFLELEGPARWIDRTAKELGFSAATYITESYGKLYGIGARPRVSNARTCGFADQGKERRRQRPPAVQSYRVWSWTSFCFSSCAPAGAGIVCGARQKSMYEV